MREDQPHKLTGTQVAQFLVKEKEDFIEMHTNIIQLKIRVKNTDGTNLADDKEIGCINYPIAALFEHVDIYLNNDIVHTRPPTATIPAFH